MKSFVFRKLVLGMTILFGALLILVGVFSYQYFLHYKDQAATQHFHNQKQIFNQYSQQISKLTDSLLQSENWILFDVKNVLSGTRDGINKLAINEINILQPKQSLKTVSTSDPNFILNQHNFAFSSALRALAETEGILSASAFVYMQDNDYQYLSSSEVIPPIELLRWMKSNYDYIQYLASAKKVIYLPPVSDDNFNRVDNFMLLPVGIRGGLVVSLVIQIDITYFTKNIFKESNSQYVIWDMSSGYAIANNVEHQATEQGVYLATRYLPPQLQHFISTKNELSVSQHQEYAEITDLDMDTSGSSPWFVLHDVIKGSNYQYVSFANAEPMLEAAIASSIKFGLVLFLSLSVLLILLFIWIGRQIALPTSRLLDYIESQSSLYDIEKVTSPRGWEKWFEKINVSFSEQRKLLSSLIEKNAKLEKSLTSRTQELHLQTLSKERNLALSAAIMNSMPDMIYYKNVDGSYLGCNKAFEHFAGCAEKELVAKYPEEIFENTLAEQLSAFDFQAIKSKRIYNAKNWQHYANGRKALLHWIVSPIINSDREVVGLLGVGRDITLEEDNLAKITQAKAEAEKANEAKNEFIANVSHEVRTPMNAIIGMLELLQNSSPNPIQSSYIDIAERSSRHLLDIINDILDFTKVSADKMVLHRDVINITEVLTMAFSNSLSDAMRKNLLLDIDISAKVPEWLVADKVRLTQIFTNLVGNAVKFTSEGSVSIEVELKSKPKSDLYNIAFSVKDTGIGIPEDKQQDVFEAFTQADTSVTRDFGGTGLGLSIVFKLVNLMAGRIELQSEPGQGTCFTITLPLEVPKQEKVKYPKLPWIIYEPEAKFKSLLTNKLKQYKQPYREMSTANQLTHEDGQLEVLLCRPSVLKEMSNDQLALLRTGKIQLQPIVFNMFSNETNDMCDVPYYPVISVPFTGRQLLTNRSENIVESDDLSGLQGDVLKDMSILVIEDNEINQQVLELMLVNEGASVEKADNGLLGLNKLLCGQYDAVILDVQMPVMDGLTCASRIRQYEQFAHLPIVAMTAHTSKLSKTKSLAAGIDLHLSKPVDKAELINSIRRLVIDYKKYNQTNPLTLVKDEINLGFALAQFNQNIDAIIGLLRRFKQSKENEIKFIAENYQEIAPSELAAKLHNLKGILGNLGADELYTITVNLEKQLKTQSKLDLALMNKWLQRINALLDKIEQL